MTFETPDPGFYYVGFDEYREWDAVNGSALLWGLHSARHMRAALDGRLSKDTPDRRFGSAYHCRFLEPERFERDYVVAGSCEAPIGSGHREGQPCDKPGQKHVSGHWYCGQHSKNCDSDTDRIVLSESEGERIERIAEALREHSAWKIVRAAGGCEVSIVFDYRGVRMKARLDKYIPRKSDKRPPYIVDMKKTQVGAADQESFGRQALNLHYHVKAVMYQAGVECLEGERPSFMWLAIEGDEPFDVCPLTMPPDMESLGKHYFESLVTLYKHCEETGEWPGSCPDIKQARTPTWAAKELDQIERASA